MSTRGLYGFRKNGVDKLTYNHADSYPDCLGRNILEFIKENGVSKLNKIYDMIRLVNEQTPPSYYQIDECLRTGITDLTVSDRTVGDWYCLTRRLQGNFEKYAELANTATAIYMIENAGFIKDSLFCEYAYIINLDDLTLEYYMGFQTEPDENNRYGTEKDGDYYPCKMVRAFDFDEIAEKSVEDIVAEMNKLAEEN